MGKLRLGVDDYGLKSRLICCEKSHIEDVPEIPDRHCQADIFLRIETEGDVCCKYVSCFKQNTSTSNM